MNVVVSGANGLIGGHLVAALCADGHRVLALSRSAAPLRLRALAPGREYAYAPVDIRDEDSLFQAISGFAPEAVFHCAVQRHQGCDITRPEEGEHWTTNVDGAAAAVRASARAGVRYFVHSSAMMVFDIDAPGKQRVNEQAELSPQEPNGLSVAMGELHVAYLAHACGLRHTILRYPGIYGTGKRNGFVARCIDHVLSHPDRPFEVRSNRRADFLWVGDAVRANMLALRRIDDAHGQVFHIGSGGTTSVREMAEAICECAQRSVRLVEATPAVNDRDFGFDIGKARSFLGYEPSSTAHGLKQVLSTWSRWS